MPHSRQHNPRDLHQTHELPKNLTEKTNGLTSKGPKGLWVTDPPLKDSHAIPLPGYPAQKQQFEKHLQCMRRFIC